MPPLTLSFQMLNAVIDISMKEGMRSSHCFLGSPLHPVLILQSECVARTGVALLRFSRSGCQMIKF